MTENTIYIAKKAEPIVTFYRLLTVPKGKPFTKEYIEVEDFLNYDHAVNAGNYKLQTLINNERGVNRIRPFDSKIIKLKVNLLLNETYVTREDSPFDEDYVPYTQASLELKYNKLPKP